MSIQILAPGGQVVREFECKSCKAGTHRVTWDLHYPGPAGFPGLILRGVAPDSGPVAPPGTYQARVTANGRTATQSFAIQRDPRLTDVTDADLTEQFKLAMQVRDATSEANRMVVRIRDLKTQLKQRSADAEIARAIAPVDQKLSSVEEEIYQVRNRSPRDTLNYPIKLNNQLAALAMLVSMGDTRPTEQSYAVFRDLSAKLDGLKSRLSQIIAVDVGELNRAFAAKKLAPITP